MDVEGSGLKTSKEFKHRESLPAASPPCLHKLNSFAEETAEDVAGAVEVMADNMVMFSLDDISPP